jgi:hypothetical protein
MSINAVNGVSQPIPQTDRPRAATSTSGLSPFSQELDAQSAQPGAARGHHHGHHEDATQPVASAATDAAPPAQAKSPNAVLSAVLKLLA